MARLYNGCRVRVHVEPNHGGTDYGPGTILEIEHGAMERAHVELDTGEIKPFNTRWLVPLPDVGSHRELYPEQYTDALIGRSVVVIDDKGQERARGVVERVANTRWGPLAHLVDGGDLWWIASACRTDNPESAG